MYDLDTIHRLNNQAVKKWYETERQKIARLRRELAQLEARVATFESTELMAAEEQETYEP